MRGARPLGFFVMYSRATPTGIILGPSEYIGNSFFTNCFKPVYFAETKFFQSPF